MIRQIVHDPMFLKQKSEVAGLADRQVFLDLRDTLKTNRERCVGMAANMIGVKKRVIIVSAGIFDMVLVNPVILSKKDPYQTEEGCLSLMGVRPVTRYREIEVEYCDESLRKKKQKFSGYVAQIIQHEMDHCEGILI